MTEREIEFNTIIVGMGNTGVSCARYLREKNISFVMTDSRDIPPMINVVREQFPDVSLYTGSFDPDLFVNARQIVISPGVSIREPAICAAINAGVKVFGDIELFCQEVKAPVVAVTGSNGKSTVTTLIAEMAKAAGINTAVGGNLGTPALDLLGNQNTELFILELSSFQLETVYSLNAVASVVLNISEDHMDRYTNIEEYKQAKSRIYDGEGTMIINLDDPMVVSMQREHRKSSGFTLLQPHENNFGVKNYAGNRWLVKGDEKLISINEIKITGEHNIANALAAFALADAIQLPREPIYSVLRDFPGLPHRCQWVAEINDVTWINDSKGTNVGATCAAIKGLSNNKNIVLIAGGDGKGADFSGLAEVAGKYLRAAVLIGKDARLIKHVLHEKIPVIETVDMSTAVTSASLLSEPGDIVLLSPACASLDMFKDYRERGEMFVRAVKQLVNSE